MKGEKVLNKVKPNKYILLPVVCHQEESKERELLIRELNPIVKYLLHIDHFSHECKRDVFKPPPNEMSLGNELTFYNRRTRCIIRINI